MSSNQTPRRSKRALSRTVVVCNVVLAILVLAACGVSPSTSGVSPTATVARTTASETPPLPPTSITVLRFSQYPQQNRVAPFVKTSEDTASVQRLYHAVFALPPPPSPPPWCPQDVGVGYQLSFIHNNTVVLQVVLSGSCSYAAISNPPECRNWTRAFIAQVAATLRVPDATLEPLDSLLNTAGPSGPFAPISPTPPILTNRICGDQFPAG
jgi:hypothetical protein